MKTKTLQDQLDLPILPPPILTGPPERRKLNNRQQTRRGNQTHLCRAEVQRLPSLPPLPRGRERRLQGKHSADKAKRA